MTTNNHSDCVISNTRTFPSTPREIFRAFEDPWILAQWWGPSGFINTFETFEFKPGGRWVFTMHSPDGANYFNDSIFHDVTPDTRIVIEHLVNPWFRLTITLTTTNDQTELRWDQEFENPDVADRMRQLCVTANEQVLDRLQAILAKCK